MRWVAILAPVLAVLSLLLIEALPQGFSFIMERPIPWYTPFTSAAFIVGDSSFGPSLCFSRHSRSSRFPRSGLSARYFMVVACHSSCIGFCVRQPHNQPLHPTRAQGRRGGELVSLGATCNHRMSKKRHLQCLYRLRYLKRRSYLRLGRLSRSYQHLALWRFRLEYLVLSMGFSFHIELIRALSSSKVTGVEAE